ncbi:MAG: NTP transferase domain-containing protein [Sandarakinorhabdus sp.]|nr:NTP transferase domain-containing protein [Sandarakinorhabdus sp.]
MGRRAVILAAGAGSRLLEVEPLKPLAKVGAEPLIRHALFAMAAAGIERATIVLGNSADAVAAAAAHGPIAVDTILNPRWADAPNGVSLLSAREHIVPGTLLMMADHLISALLVARLLAGARLPLALGVDRRLGHPWVDESDVTRVRTDGELIRAIGKGLGVYDSYDSGVFIVGPELVHALDGLSSPGLSDGVMQLARRGLAQAVDIGDAPWLDVDDARALAIARTQWVAA